MSLFYTEMTQLLAPETRAWRELRFARTSLVMMDLWRASGIDLTPLCRLVDAWETMGMIDISKDRTITMTDDARRRKNPPPTLRERPKRFNPQTGRQRIWAAIRVLGSFELPALTMAAEISRNSAMDYLNQLERAGYVKRLDSHPDRRSGTHPRYRLQRNTGPRHPIVGRHRTSDGPVVRITDANTGDVVTVSLQPKSLRDRDELSFAPEN